MTDVVYDFHTHTFLSDGELSPVELIRRAAANGYKAVALTDHVSISNMESVIRKIKADCRLAEEYWGITTITGVELTHVPAGSIAVLAKKAKELGAEIVVVHGETVVEPVEPGTNFAAVTSADVDILAHPGFLTVEEAGLAKRNGVLIEITARKGHSITNGHVARIGKEAGVNFIIDSDAHAPGDLLTADWVDVVARGSGLSLAEINSILDNSHRIILSRVKQKRDK